MSAFIDRHESIIRGVLGCYDRVVVSGTLPGICYADGMTAFLDSKKIRIFDYPRFAEPYRDAIRAEVDKVAAAEGVTIEFIRKVKSFRKEDRIQKIIAERGSAPGLVHIFSAMEACTSYKPWHNRVTGQTFLRYDTGKCIHYYYFYFIDPLLGLCYLPLAPRRLLHRHRHALDQIPTPASRPGQHCADERRNVKKSPLRAGRSMRLSAGANQRA